MRAEGSESKTSNEAMAEAVTAEDQPKNVVNLQISEEILIKVFRFSHDD